MATHRRGTAATQWSVGDLLRREGRSWPSLSPAAKGVAVGSALLASTAVAVSMAAEPQHVAPPSSPEPAPGGVTPSAEADPTPGPGSGHSERTSPFGAEGSVDDPAIALGPGVAPVQVPHAPAHRPALPDLSARNGDDGPVDGRDIVAGALDPDARSGADDEHPDRKDSDRKDSDDKRSDNQRSATTHSDSNNSDGEDSKGKHAESKHADDEDADGKHSADKDSDGEDSKHSSDKDSDDEDSDGRHSDDKHSDDKDSDDKHSDDKTGRQGLGRQGLGRQASADRDSDDKDSESKGAADKDSDSKDSDRKDSNRRTRTARTPTPRTPTHKDADGKNSSDKDADEQGLGRQGLRRQGLARRGPGREALVRQGLRSRPQGPRRGRRLDGDKKDHEKAGKDKGDDQDRDRPDRDTAGETGRRPAAGDTAVDGTGRLTTAPVTMRLRPDRTGATGSSRATNPRRPLTDAGPTAAPGRPPGRRSRSGLDQALADRPQRGLRPRRQPQLREHVAHVGLDGAVADGQQPADVAVRPALGDQHEDLALAGGQRGDAPPRGDERVREHAGHGGVEVHLAPAGGADRLHDLVDVGVLQHVPGRPRLQRAVDAVRLAEAGDDDDVHLPATTS